MRKPPLSMMSAVVASVWPINSRNAASSCWMSSSISWGRVAMSCGLGSALVDEFLKQHARDHVERLKHPLAFVRGAIERRHLHFAVVQKIFHVFGRRGVRQVAFVVLQDVRNFRDV